MTRFGNKSCQKKLLTKKFPEYWPKMIWIFVKSSKHTENICWNYNYVCYSVQLRIFAGLLDWQNKTSNYF